MAEEQIQSNQRPTMFFEWEFLEFEKHARSQRWYIITAIVGTALLIYAIVAANFLFALIILLIGFILFARELSEPHKMRFAITDEGVYVDRKFYPYKDLQEFYVIYEPPYVKQLYITTRGLGFNLSIPLEDINPVKLREVLLDYLDENLDIEDEDFSETIGKALKL